MARARHVLKSVSGAFDLPSIITGVVVVGILAAGILAAVFAVIPFSQDNSAKQDLDSVRTAQGVAKAKDSGYMDKASLIAVPYLSSGDDVAVSTNTDRTCYLALSKSGTGKIYYSDNKSNEAKELVAGATVNCITPAQLDDMITDVGGYGPGSSNPSAGGPGGDSGGGPGGSDGGGGTYTPGGAVPVGYTYGANFGACPAPFAEALKARFLADGSQKYFLGYSLPWNDPAADAAWDDYAVLDDAAWELESALTPSQKATYQNFRSYADEVPGYTAAEDAWWDTYSQASFNQMNELMASAVPTFCGAVSAGSPTFKCAPGVHEYLTLANAYYHNYMYENQRYTADGSDANYNAWIYRPTSPQEYPDDAAKDAAYNNVMALNNGYSFYITQAQNQVRAENTAAWSAFAADTSRTNFDTWVNYEYPTNVCR
ncbi:hypothetical protein [Pseudarthrobacter chlorophenolicus]|uniref:hypothetical protein n=1 Tax=Pseudarthrobacter chlorophenolicus TaxID=85085 RepID=UPI00142EC87D|nr:hypothetical protein [Pseudarthrobacter chlorophenolicus]